jgi:SAM-dependent methyltransferase
MRRLVEAYLDKTVHTDILDVGSFDVNGNYSSLFKNELWSYIGADIEAGPNVNVVLKSEYDWGLLACFDVVISGQTLEHVKNPFKFVASMAKACKPDGLCFIIVPWMCVVHRHPVDCWRILPDGMIFMMEEAGFKTLECGMWNDFTGNDTVYAGIKVKEYI